VIAGQMIKGMGNHDLGAGGITGEGGGAIQQFSCRRVQPDSITNGVVIGGDHKTQAGIQSSGCAPGKQRTTKKRSDVFAWDPFGTTTQRQESNRR